MTRPAWPAAILALALAVAPAAAQVPITPAQPDPSDPDAVLVEELVVTARDLGPAWWRVSNGTSTVYVLGVPSVIPKGLAWDRSTLERRLEGANEVILPFNAIRVGVLGAPGALFNLMRLKARTPIEASLPPDLKTRFAAARAAVGRPPERYATNNGLAAGLLLVEDFREAAKLTAADPAKTIGRLAKAKGVKVDARSYNAGPILGAVIRTPKPAQRACLDDALHEVEAGPAAARAAGEGWARGDVRAALGAERGFEKCLSSAPGAAQLDAKFKADQAQAIAQALKRPGHAIAVAPLRPLLSQGGILDRLRAQGYEIKTPDEA